METHNESVAPYAAFGNRLLELRLNAGIALQRDLAKLLSCAQQTVSRWEAGTSRPRASQIPTIAAALNADVGDLMIAAGYTSKPAIVSFDQPFPVDALAPESFERFALYFLSKLYPGASVVRYGGPGHKQDGLDVLVTTADGTRHTFQCKRESEFGPQKVHTAVANHTAKADQKVILLTRTASPLARAAIDQHEGWGLWDREDISRKVRDLPLEEQHRLVRIFFRGQELALLGSAAVSPWEITEEFFAPFKNSAALFNHEWDLVGRVTALDELSKALHDKEVRVVFLAGAGGSGKSRVLKQAIEAFAQTNLEVAIRWLSRDGEITKQSLLDLGDRPTLLVVDDAHDRDDLQPLFEHAATRHDLTQVVLAFRPYGLEHIRAQASSFSLAGRLVGEVMLGNLSKADAEHLAKQVLARRGGPLAAAKDIANLTFDCPLATVIGAQVVAAEGVRPDLAQNEDVFRKTLYGRFEQVVAGRLGEPADAVPIKKLLRFLALVQPMHIEDDVLLGAFGKMEVIALHDVKRLLRQLIQAGVLFKRGARYRLSPDVLGDYLIEDRCVGTGGMSTGYAEAVFDELEPVHNENLLLNLARLDWRRTDAHPDESPLLDGVWAKLKPESKYGDPHIKAVQAVAYYQPKRALEFVERTMRDGTFVDQVAEIAKYAAYNRAYLRRALECLWELGHCDGRQLSQHPAHPIRIMTELAEPQPNKPPSYIQDVVDFALELIDRPDSWRGSYTPMDILEAALSTEGHQSFSTGRAISFAPFFVSPEVMAPLRDKVIDVAIRLLADPDTPKAVRAAAALGTALRYPIGGFGTAPTPELREAWTKDFVGILGKIQAAVSSGEIDTIVQFEINRSVAWLAGDGNQTVARPARQIIDSLASSLEYRTERALMDGHGMGDRRANKDGHEARWEKFLGDLVAELVETHGDSEALRAFIEVRLTRIKEADKSDNSSPYVLIMELLKTAPAFAQALIDDALARSNSLTSRFSGAALGDIMQRSAHHGRTLIKTMLQSGRSDLCAAIGLAYGQQDYSTGWFGEDDHLALSRMLASTDEWPVLCALRSLHRIAEWSEAEALRLVRIVNFSTARIADETATLFEFGHKLPFSALSKEDALSLLDRLEPLPQLDGYWIDKLLSRVSMLYPDECAAFFMRRVEAASSEGADRMRPCNFGPWAPNDPDDRLAFRKSSSGMKIMREVALWMRDNGDRKGLFSYYSRQLFETMFGPYDDEVVAFLNEWLKQAQEADIRLIAQIVRQADQDFVFKYAAFVASFLDRARQFGPKVHRMASSELYCSAIAGMRSGTPGEPFPQDVVLKKQVEGILASIPRFSAAYSLYEDLGKHADQEIRRALREAEEFED